MELLSRQITGRIGQKLGKDLNNIFIVLYMNKHNNLRGVEPSKTHLLSIFSPQ